MLDLIILSRTDRYLDRLLASLWRSQWRPWKGGRRLLVGDNGLSPECRARHRECEFIPVPEPFNFSGAINRCAAQAEADHDFLMLNDDTEVLSRDLLVEVERALRDPRAARYGILSPRIEGGVGNPDQARWAPPGEYFTTRTTLCFIAVVIPRRVWDEAGPMDERFTAYGCDDADAGRRVVEAGYQLGVMGWLAVRHGIPEEGIAAHGTYRQRYKLAEHARLGQEALRIFADKWGGGPQLGAYAQMIDP